MLNTTNMSADALWKQRFRVSVTHSEVSKADPTRGIAARNRSGVFQLYGITLDDDGAVGDNRRLYQNKRFTFGPTISHNGEIIVVGTSEHSEKLQFHLVAVDTTTGEQIAESWDAPDTSREPGSFSPIPGDMRMTATSNRTGTKRPLIWNPRTGERIDLKLRAVQRYARRKGGGLPARFSDLLRRAGQSAGADHPGPQRYADARTADRGI